MSFIVFVAMVAAVMPTVASAAGVILLSDTFANSALANPSSWSLPAGSSGVCLTAGTNTLTTPVPDCQSSGGDANGSGALRLTDNAANQVGTIFSNVTLPTADGLDVTWDSYQYNGTGADGISFDFAAANPANPAPPTTTGPNGGSLGYVTDGGVQGMPNGYLGFGADVYGNFENSGFGGSGCSVPSPATPESMGVRGPGNGTTGYCLLMQEHLASPLTLDSKSATSRTGLAVPEEVVINSTGSAVTASDSGVSVPAGDYLFATEPLTSGLAGTTWESVIGVLPTDPTGVPAGWLGTNGLPQTLAFGWAASTGGSNEFHDINNLQATSLIAGPVLSLSNTDSGSGVLYTNSSDTVTLTPGVASTSTVNETGSVTVTDTFPAGLTPSSASGTGWTCSVAGQNVSCTLPAGNVAPGVSFAAITVDVIASVTPGPFTNTARVTSTDGAPATASDTGSIDAPLTQVINFTNTPPSPLYVNGTYTVTASGGASGNPVVLSVDGSSTSSCTIDASTGIVTLSAPAGTCVIDANQAGNAAYGAAAQVQQSVSYTTTPQAITFTNTPPWPLYVTGTYTVTATGGASGKPVVLSVDGASTSGCTIDASSGVVTLSTPVGTCVIDANQAGNAAYGAAAQVQQSVTDVAFAQVINFTNTPPSPLYVNGTYIVTATGGASGNTVVLSVDGASTSGCTIDASSGIVTLTSPAGTCVIDANQAGNSTFGAAAQVQQSVSDTTTPQVINFTNTPPSPLYVNGTYTVTATGGASGNTVVLSVDGASTSGCMIDASSGIVTLASPAGTCVIDANQAANAAYGAAAQVQQSIDELVLTQAINFTNTPPSPLYVNGSYTVTATGGGSGNTVVLSVDGSSTSSCTIDASSGIVTLTSPTGTCVIDANQAGNAAYGAASQVQQSVNDTTTPQAITFTNTPPADPPLGSTYVVTATGGGSGNPVSLSVDGASTSGCTIDASSGVVTLAAPAGTCVIDANQAGNSIYGAAPQVQQLVDDLVLAQTITLTNTPPTDPPLGSTYVVNATGGASGDPVTLSVDSSSTSGCTIDASTGVVTLSAPVGTCVIDANQAGNSTYGAAAQVQQSVADLVFAQVINFTNTPPSPLYVNGTYAVTATGGGSGNPVVLSVDHSSTSGCTIDAATGVVTLSAPVGTCVIDANQAGNSVYGAAAQVQQSVNDLVLTQVITFTNTAPSDPPLGSTYTVTATGGGSGNPVVFSVDSSSTSGCTIDASTGVVTLSAPVGTCVIDANQAGNPAYGAATQVQQSVASRTATLSLVLYYANNSCALTAWSVAHLHSLALSIKSDRLTSVEISGFASSTGTVARNNVLGIERAWRPATRLRTYLKELHVRHVTLHMMGYGASKFATRPTSAPANRRTEITVN